MIHRGLVILAAASLPFAVAQCGAPTVPAPTPAPIVTPGPRPTAAPTVSPKPTIAPTAVPSVAPTASPVPSSAPSAAPTATSVASPPPSVAAIPVAAQIGKRQTKYLSPGEVAFIAQRYGTDSNPQSWIALSNFGQPCKDWPYVEDGVTANTALLHAANPKLRVLAYWGYHGNWHTDCMRAYLDPTYQANKSTWVVNGDLDITNPGLRDWWTTAATFRVSDENLDGLYVDGLGDAIGDPLAPYKVALYSELRTKLDALGRGHLLLIANGGAGSMVANGLGPYIDGDMTEGYNRTTAAHAKPPTPADNLAMLEASWSLTQSKHYSLLKTWPAPYDFTNWPSSLSTYPAQVAYARTAIGFQLASFLAIEDPQYSTIMYSGGYETDALFDVIANDSADPSTWTIDPAWYADLAGPNPAGVPLGPPVFNATALTVDRDFSGGHLHVDLGARTFTGIQL